jgi:hypothetical protein
LDEFANEVLGDEHVIESFNNFKTDYEQDMQINIAEEFPISEAAVKKTQRHFKSIIKLDKNFHIYIHGDRQKWLQGKMKKENTICCILIRKCNASFQYINLSYYINESKSSDYF